MKQFLKFLDDLLNEKNFAMLVLFGLGIGAYINMGAGAKDVVIPIITGICSFITGYATGRDGASRPPESKEDKS